jgi:hypothetical protein
MDRRSNSVSGWVGFSAVVLTLGGIFAVIDGLMAVYKTEFFTSNAVFAFSDLNTWGWIVFGLGVAGIVSGLAVFSGSEYARWLGVTVAGIGAVGQLLFAQAYPLWSLVITAVYFLAIYGLLARGGEERAVSSMGSYSETSATGSVDSEMPADVSSLGERSRRAA